MKQKLSTTCLWLICWLLAGSTLFISFPSKNVAGQAASPLAQPLTDTQVLPDAVYFLNERDQVARLEADGQQVTIVTQEEEPVIAFDVAPDGSRLAYISGNNLIEIEYDMVAMTRRVKVQGAAYDPADMQQTMTQSLNSVMYTPDGKYITFGRNGINWIAGGASDAAGMLLPNDPYPAPNQPGPTRFVWPAAWSPDGQHLLFRYAYYASDDIGQRVLDLKTGAEAQVCRSAVWGRDSQHVLCREMIHAQEMGTLLEIAQINTVTGARTTLVQGVPDGQPTADNPYRLFHSVYQTPDGAFLAFGAVWATLPPTATPVTFYDVQRYTLQRVSANGRQITPLRTDRYRLGGTLLWANDGSGVLMSDATTSADGRQAAPLLWLPSDGSPAIELFAVGRAMQWRTRPLSTLPTSLPQATAIMMATTQATVLQTLNVRTGPDTLYTALTQLAVGTTVQVTRRTTLGSEPWLQIVYPPNSDGRAWINGDPTLVQIAQGAQIPVVAP